MGSHELGSHGLGPHVVGQRIVVRRVLPGETGPTGGPAFSDVLGVCRSWGQGRCEVEREDGTLASVAIGDIVSGKPIPPRPSVRHRVAPGEVHVRSLAMWPGLERQALGDWVLRAGGRAEPTPEHTQGRPVARGNSVLAFGDPGVPVAEAAEAVAAFYRDRGLPVLAQVEVTSEVGGEVDSLLTGLTGLGWVPARPDEADSFVQLASVARAVRAARSAAADPAARMDVVEDDEKPIARLRVAASVEGTVVARVSAVVEGDWIGLYDLWVDPEHRRHGLGRAVTAEALDWAASRGATTAYLQVVGDNHTAVALFAGLGFTTHHAYRYLAPPPPDSP